MPAIKGRLKLVDSYNDKFPCFDSALTLVARRMLAEDALGGGKCLCVGSFDGLFGVLLARSVNVVHISTDPLELGEMTDRLTGPSVEYYLITNLGLSYSSKSLRIGLSLEDLERDDGLDYLALRLDLESEAGLLAGMKFNHAILIRALHHASDPAALARAAYDHLLPGGTLYVIDFWAESLDGTIRKFFPDSGLLKRYVERMQPGIDDFIELIDSLRESEQESLISALRDIADACGRPRYDGMSGAVEAGIATMNDWVGDYYRCRARGFHTVADVTGFWGRLSAGSATVTLCDEGCQYVAEWTKP